MQNDVPTTPSVTSRLWLEAFRPSGGTLGRLARRSARRREGARSENVAM
jgi:hypothetical protein